MLKLFKRDKKADAAPKLAVESGADADAALDAGAGAVSVGEAGSEAVQASAIDAKAVEPASETPAVRKSALSGGLSGSPSSVSPSSADLEPLRGLIGHDAARDAVRAIRRLEPRAAIFLSAPRSSGHAEALRTLTRDEAAAIAPGDAVVIMSRFGGSAALDVFRLAPAEATAFRDGVASVVEMLSATIPAAFESDSFKVARIALDEELRSGHDSALDALRRKADGQNIGLLRTTNGYAVVPMHEGRVVRGEIFDALPGSLKSDVEAKLALFEAELLEVLKQRAGLQQLHHERVKELERDAAALSVDAAIGTLLAKFKSRADLGPRLAALRADLIENALLFVAANRDAGGVPRAPIEIARDRRFARYRVNVLARPGGAGDGLELPETLERAELIGMAICDGPGRLQPDAVVPGALTRPGGGVVMIDVRDLIGTYSAWPLIKHALKSARAAPVAVGEGGLQHSAGLDLPVEVRLVFVGETEDYASWCRLDPDVGRLVRLIEAFPATAPSTAALKSVIARHLAGFASDDGLLPFDGPALYAVIDTLALTCDGDRVTSTELGPARDLMGAASATAQAASRVMVLAADVGTAQAKRMRARQPVEVSA
jgi:predicted ATP-dependent protease